MGISELLSNAYAKVEDAYYGVLDFFEEKGIGLPWNYNDFLENKGIPALPFTLALIFLLFAGVGIVWAGAQPIDKDITFNLKDGKGNPLQDVSVKIFDAEGNLLREATVSDGTTLTLRGLKPGTQLQIQASKDGYGSREINLDGNDNDIALSLEGENDVISGKIKLVDRESQTTITDAVLTLEWAGNTNTLVVSPGADGIAVFSDLPKDQELFLTVRADDYENLSEAITFSNDDVKIKELVPKASASSGNSIFLVKAIDAQNKNVLQDVHIKIENARTGDIISDLDDADGLHSETLAKGMVVRVTISKEGYLTYTSNTAFPDGKTLRKEEENIIAEMDFGGTSLFVIAQGGSGGQALDSVSLTLLDAQYEKIQSLTSNFSGETEFPGLNETQAYTLLAFHPNYFPARQTIDWASLPASEKGKTLLFPLTPITSGQSGVLTAFVIEANGKAGVGATVSITELTDGIEGELPLLAPQPTDIAGSFSVKLPVGMRLRIAADKGDLHAEQEITIVAGLNRVNLNLDGKETPLRINLRYRSGDLFIGSVVIESTSGTQLFSDAVVDGIVDVDPLTNNTLNLTATPTNGTPIRKTINVEGRDSIDVILDETTSASSDAPEIKFLGIVDAQGNFVPGITPDAESFARFEVKWPTAASTAPARKGIVHVRVGSDATRSSDSQFLGIYGVNAPNAVAEYGKSWNPTPAPGNEYKDRSTKGKAGSYNKWIELQHNNPSGTQIIDVRLKARVGIPLGTQELHYRAELQTSGSVARNPGDALLGSNPYTKEKSGLYAQTLSTTIPVYSAIPICKGSICARVSFIDNTAREYPIGNFTAMRSAPYALQVELLPSARKDATTSSAVGVAQESNPNLVPLASVTSANPNIPALATGTTAAPTVNTAALAQLRATTSPANPSLVFTKGELNTFGPLAKEGQQETTIAIPLTGFGNAQTLKARVHFVPQRNGEGSISLQITAGSEVWSEEIPISIVDPKTLSVEYAHNVNPGESITFTVNAETTSSPVVDALISLLDAQNKTIASVQGNNLANAGANGKYVLSKAIAPGLYAIKVAAPGFVPYEDTIAIGIKGAIELEETIALNIPAGQKSITQAVAVKNNSSFPLSNVTTELEAIGKFPSTLKVEAKTIEVIPPKGNATLTLTATYAGEASDATPLSGSMQLKLRAEANAQFPIYASSQLNVSYNRQLDSSCLQFDKQKLSVLVTEDEQPYPSNNYYSSTPGSAGNSYDYYGNRYSTQNPAYNASGYNQYGYDPSGAYANPTQKRVGVKVKNNCGTDLDLITSINPSSGQQEVDGLKIAAVDSTLKLQNGQEKQVDFSVQNQLFRAGSAGLFQPGIPIMYGIQFRAPQLAAMLPLEINFFSRATALQTPQAITLNLIKSGNQKAVDRVPVNITNASPGPVFGISAQISDGYDASSLYQGGSEGLLPAAGYNQNFRGQVQPPLQGVTLRVENVVGNATLGPGQSLLPPIVVVGESTSDKVQSGLKTLTISGIVDGRRSILRQIPVYVQVGTSSCLKITATNTPVSFVSTETTGTQSQRVLIRNECLEPVRIGQISPSTAGANTLVLVALDGDNSLEKDQEKGFQFLLTKTTPYKGNFSVEVQGLLVLSQKIVKTEPIPLEVRLGANELSSANVSGLTQVPVCENPNERIGVRFPILATRDECSQAYCDAEQLANMLSRVVEQQIGKAAQLMQSKKNDAAQIPGCDLGKRSCSFAQMGIQGSVFEVFLQNDALSPQMMQYVMRGEKYPRLQGMQAELLPTLLGENADASFESKLGAGFGNKLFMPEIQGCGAYQLAIVGGVEMSGAQLQPEQINVGIKLIAPRRDTAECQYKIQNVANFLPKNRSLTNANNSQQTLFGNVESTPDLQASAETLAETVFGSKNRVSTNSGGSRLELRVGNQAESIVELTLDPATQGEGSKHVIGLVKRTQNTVQKEAVVEVGRIITQLGKGVNGCITRDERTWKIFSAPNIGTFQFAGCALDGTKEGGLAVRGSQACCVLNTKSEIQSNVSYALNPSGTNPIPGLTQLNLYEVATNTSDPKNPIPGNVLVNGAEYPLTFNAQTNGYQQSILLCGTADGQTQAQARNALVNATATRVNDGKVAGPLQLQVKVCTQNPADALAGAVKRGNGTYYTTANLEAAPTKQQTIAQAIADISDGQKLPASYFSFQGNGVRANDNAVYQQQIKNQQGKALGWGFGACQAACMACHGGIGLVFGGGGFFAKFASSTGQCAMGCGFGAVVGVAQVYKDDISQIPILGPIVDTIRSIFGGLTDGLAEAFDIEPENRPAFDAGVVGSSIGLLSGGGWKGMIVGGTITVAFAQVMEYVLSDEVQQKTDGYKESVKEGTTDARDASVSRLQGALNWFKGVIPTPVPIPSAASSTNTGSTSTPTPTSSPATGQVTLLALSPATGLATGLPPVPASSALTPFEVFTQSVQQFEYDIANKFIELESIIPQKPTEGVARFNPFNRSPSNQEVAIARFELLDLRNRVAAYRAFLESFDNAIPGGVPAAVDRHGQMDILHENLGDVEQDLLNKNYKDLTATKDYVKRLSDSTRTGFEKSSILPAAGEVLPQNRSRAQSILTTIGNAAEAQYPGYNPVEQVLANSPTALPANTVASADPQTRLVAARNTLSELNGRANDIMREAINYRSRVPVPVQDIGVYLQLQAELEAVQGQMYDTIEGLRGIEGVSPQSVDLLRDTVTQTYGDLDVRETRFSVNGKEVGLGRYQAEVAYRASGIVEDLFPRIEELRVLSGELGTALEPLRPLDDIALGPEVGRGGTGNVVYSIRGDNSAVVKIIESSTDTPLREALRLGARTNALPSDVGVARVWEVGTIGGKVAIIMPRARGEQLHPTNNTYESWSNRLAQMANAPQEHFDRLVRDIHALRAKGLTVDTASPGNLFYDPVEGFTIIDPTVPTNPQDAVAFSAQKAIVDNRNLDRFLEQGTADDATNVLATMEKLSRAGDTSYDNVGRRYAVGEVEASIKSKATAAIQRIIASPANNPLSREMIVAGIEAEQLNRSPVKAVRELADFYGPAGQTITRVDATDVPAFVSEIDLVLLDITDYRDYLARVRDGQPTNPTLDYAISELDATSVELQRIRTDVQAGEPVLQRVRSILESTPSRVSIQEAVASARQGVAEIIAANPENVGSVLQALADPTAEFDPVAARGTAQQRAEALLNPNVRASQPIVRAAAEEVAIAGAAVEEAIAAQAVAESGDVAERVAAAQARADAEIDFTLKKGKLNALLQERGVLPDASPTGQQFASVIDILNDGIQEVSSTPAPFSNLVSPEQVDLTRLRLNELQLLLDDAALTYEGVLDRVGENNPQLRSEVEAQIRRLRGQANVAREQSALLEKQPTLGNMQSAKKRIAAMQGFFNDADTRARTAVVEGLQRVPAQADTVAAVAPTPEELRAAAAEVDVAAEAYERMLANDQSDIDATTAARERLASEAADLQQLLDDGAASLETPEARTAARSAAAEAARVAESASSGAPADAPEVAEAARRVADEGRAAAAAAPADAGGTRPDASVPVSGEAPTPAGTDTPSTPAPAPAERRRTIASALSPETDVPSPADVEASAARVRSAARAVRDAPSDPDARVELREAADALADDADLSWDDLDEVVEDGSPADAEADRAVTDTEADARDLSRRAADPATDPDTLADEAERLADGADDAADAARTADEDGIGPRRTAPDAEVYHNGVKINPDGTLVFPDGMVLDGDRIRFSDGRVVAIGISADEFKLITTQDGTLTTTSVLRGETKSIAGTDLVATLDAEGNPKIVRPDGIEIENEIRFNDGTVIDADGVVYRDGAEIAPNGLREAPRAGTPAPTPAPGAPRDAPASERAEFEAQKARLDADKATVDATVREHQALVDEIAARNETAREARIAVLENEIRNNSRVEGGRVIPLTEDDLAARLEELDSLNTQKKKIAKQAKQLEALREPLLEQQRAASERIAAAQAMFDAEPGSPEFRAAESRFNAADRTFMGTRRLHRVLPARFAGETATGAFSKLKKEIKPTPKKPSKLIKDKDLDAYDKKAADLKKKLGEIESAQGPRTVEAAQARIRQLQAELDAELAKPVAERDLVKVADTRLAISEQAAVQRNLENGVVSDASVEAALLEDQVKAAEKLSKAARKQNELLNRKAKLQDDLAKLEKQSKALKKHSSEIDSDVRAGRNSPEKAAERKKSLEKAIEKNAADQAKLTRDIADADAAIERQITAVEEARAKNDELAKPPTEEAKTKARERVKALDETLAKNAKAVKDAEARLASPNNTQEELIKLNREIAVLQEQRRVAELEKGKAQSTVNAGDAAETAAAAEKAATEGKTPAPPAEPPKTGTGAGDGTTKPPAETGKTSGAGGGGGGGDKPGFFKRNSEFIKATAKGFVCDTAGAIAGYKVYAGQLKDEIENKVTIEPGSDNVLDPNSGEIIFKDGQTYKITVTPDSSVKGGKKLTIDIVSPQEKIPANAWVDDCGQTPVALDRLVPTTSTPTNASDPAEAARVNELIQQAIREGNAAGVNAANAGEVTP